MQKLSITWLGHSTFIIGTPGGKRLLFDPWLSSNPSCPDSMRKPPKVDLILASHSGMSQEIFAAEAAGFFMRSPHPVLRKPYRETVYQPMLELLTYLRINGFDMPDVKAEFVQLGAVQMLEPCRYAVIVDRISHDVPFYRAWLTQDGMHRFAGAQE